MITALLGIASILFVKWVNAQEMLVVPSIAEHKTAPRNLNDLFNELGASVFESPCDQLKKYTKKYCSINGLKVLMRANILTETESLFYEKILKSPDPCKATARYVWRLCAQENFEKLIKYYREIK